MKYDKMCATCLVLQVLVDIWLRLVIGSWCLPSWFGDALVPLCPVSLAKGCGDVSTSAIVSSVLGEGV